MDRRTSTRICSLCALAYFTSYLMRHGFAAGLVEITAALNLPASTASLACTGLFITYGAGQFLSGWLGDKISPRKLITFGLIGTALCNLSLLLLTNIWVIVAIWCVNGVMQALLYPPMLRLMAETLDNDGYIRGCNMVSVACNIGTIVVYAMMSVFVHFHYWQGYFLVASVLGLVIAAVFCIATRNLPVRNQAVPVKAENSAEPVRKERLSRLALVSGLPLIMLAILMQGMLRDGVTTWMPTLIVEAAHLDASTSVLSTAVLPLFSVLCIALSTKLHRRQPNATVSSTAMFLISAACAVGAAAILPLPNTALWTVLLITVITGCAHAINHLLINFSPGFFAPYGCVSSVAGLINSCTYIGSAVSTYGIAVLSESYGWGTTIIVWGAISLVGAACCLLAIRRWGRFIRHAQG